MLFYNRTVNLTVCKHSIEVLYQNYYRTKSNRKPGRDYRLPGWYFVTFCTKNMEEYFGKIHNGIMGLNTIGCIVADEIQKTSRIRPYIKIPRWVIMPNHVHLLIQVRDKWTNTYNDNVETVRRTVSTNNIRTVSANHINQKIETIIFDVSSWVLQYIPIFQRKNDSIGDIVRCIKQFSTKRIRKHHNPYFAWQSNYHDRIITNESQLYACKNYILQNPLHWNNN